MKWHMSVSTQSARKDLSCHCALYPARSCVVGCYTTEDYFLAKQGVVLLLDLLSVSSCVLILKLLIQDFSNVHSHLKYVKYKFRYEII